MILTPVRTAVAGAALALAACAHSPRTAKEAAPVFSQSRTTDHRGDDDLLSGGLRLDGLRAGQYLAIALSAEDVYLDDPSPNNFELLATLATPVVVNEGASVTLDLKRITLGTLP